jgi:hypothetical protein
VDKPTPSSKTETSPPSEGHSTLKRLGIGVLVVLSLLALVVLYRIRVVAERLEQALEELDRTDLGWRLADIEAARAQIPNSENSALLSQAAAALLPKSWPAQDLYDLLKAEPPELLSATEFMRLESEIKKVAPAVEAARGMADLPHGRFAADYQANPLAMLLPGQLENRQVASLLAFDVRHLAQTGDTKGALRSCVAGLNTARALADEPLFVSQLIRIACGVVTFQSIERALAQVEPSAQDLEVLQRVLEDEDHTNGLLTALRGERGYIHLVFVTIEDGRVKLEQFFRDLGSEGPSLDQWLPWKARYDARAEHPEILALMSDQIANARLPLHEQLAKQKELEAKLRDPTSVGRFTRMLVPAAHKFSIGFRRYHASLRSLIVLLAAERFRRVDGHWPESIEQLRPKYLAEVPLDPFDGKPMRYQRLTDGIQVYSVGPDESDNGGNVDREKPMEPGTDFGFRLWDVQHRRQPARPKPAAPAAADPPR